MAQKSVKLEYTMCITLKIHTLSEQLHQLHRDSKYVTCSQKNRTILNMELTFSTVHTVQCKVNIYCIALQERICTAHQYVSLCNVHYTLQDVHMLCQKPVYCATTESHFASLLIKRQENNFSSRNKLNFATSITMIVQKVRSVGKLPFDP